MCCHGGRDAPEDSGPGGGEKRGEGHAGVALCQPVKGQRVDRNAAAVHGQMDFGGLHAAHFSEHREDTLLNRVLQCSIVLQRLPEMAGGNEHTGVLSGAVAVDGRPGDAGDLQGVLGGDIHGVFCPAA